MEENVVISPEDLAKEAFLRHGGHVLAAYGNMCNGMVTFDSQVIDLLGRAQKIVEMEIGSPYTPMGGTMAVTGVLAVRDFAHEPLTKYC